MNKLQRLEKQYTRDYSLAINEWWQMEVFQCFEQYFGIGYSDIPIIHDGETATVWNLPNDEQAIRRVVLSVFLKSPKFLDDCLVEFINEAHTTRQILKTYSRHPLSARKIVDVFERHRLLFPGLRLSVRIPSQWRDDYVTSAKGRRLIALAYRARKESDGLFEDIDLLLRKTGAALLKRIQLPVDAKFLALSDLMTLAHGEEFDRQALLRRKHGYVAARGKVYTTKSPHETLRLLGYQLPKEGKLSSSVNGTVAFQAKSFVGRVTILKSIEQVRNFPSGNVLVSPMTVPPFISAMKKAAAIVTDEGGLTCHAAIVARELKKPCIIGTKVATKVFKDGDMVEVDATKGIVRKIAAK